MNWFLEGLLYLIGAFLILTAISLMGAGVRWVWERWTYRFRESYWHWHPRGWAFRWKRVPLVTGTVLLRQFGPWRSISRYRHGS